MTTAPREDITVPIPQNADHAVLMFCIAHDWLKQNAPERFTEAHQRALSQAGGESITGEQLRREVFALCEDTEEKCREIAARDLEGKQGAYARGRIKEAKSIRNAIGEICSYADVRASGGIFASELPPSPPVSAEREREDKK